MTETREDKNNLSYWFPKLLAAGLPVPRTEIIEMPKEAARDLWNILESAVATGDYAAFVETAKLAGDKIGWPLFLRSGHTSGKHAWGRTCFVPDRDALGAHMANIAYFSECVSMAGELPWTTWAFRELLPTKPVGLCPSYCDMPICREFRFFVRDGAVECWHPYWPRHALEMGGAKVSDDAYANLCSINPHTTATGQAEELEQLRALVCAAGRAVGGGSWSVDMLETERGWYLTDMAVGERSWHWEECVNSAHAQESPR